MSKKRLGDDTLIQAPAALLRVTYVAEAKLLLAERVLLLLLLP